jgi:hypothetical protein
MASTRTLVWIAGLAGLLAGISLSTHRRREAGRRLSPAKPEPVQTWEEEGGSVPLHTGRTAQQVTPTTAQPAVQPSAEPDGPHEIESGPHYPQGRMH